MPILIILIALSELSTLRKEYEGALLFLLRVLWIDMNGTMNGPYPWGFAPEIVRRIRSLGNCFSVDLTSRVCEQSLPYILYSKEEFERIVVSIIDGSFDVELEEGKRTDKINRMKKPEEARLTSA